MGAPPGLAGTHRQDRLAALERLHLALCIDTPPHGARLLRRIEMESDEGADFPDKEGLGGELAILLQMRLAPAGPPKAHEGVLIEAAGLGHGAGTPVRGILGPGLPRAGDDGLNLRLRELARRTRARGITQSPQPSVEETRPPLAHGLAGDSTPGCHGGVPQAGRAIQHDPRARGRAWIGLRSAGHHFQFGLFLGI